jgi:hypothetical protein
MATKSTLRQRKMPSLMPSLMAVRVFDGAWAVVSNDKRKPLTKSQANRIIAAYLAIIDLQRGNA